MQIRTTYEQLQPEDRMTIASMHRQGCSMRAMARMLRRSPSTISRELVRNAAPDITYGSHVAQQSCQARQRAARPAPKLAIDGIAWGIVLTLLDWKWSPQQIAGTSAPFHSPRKVRACSAVHDVGVDAVGQGHAGHTEVPP